MKLELFIKTIIIMLLTGCSNSILDAIPGAYYGYLPCADCPGIYYKLVLDDEGNYSESMYYVDRNDVPITENGRYSLENDSLIVLHEKNNPDETKFFVLTNGRLRMLDRYRKEVESEFSDRYILDTLKPIGFNGSLKSDSANLDFKATGNEPFWGLEINFDKNARFHVLAEGNNEIIIPMDSSEKNQDDTLSYSLSSEGGNLEIRIIRKTCQDNMSGKEFPYTVIVSATNGGMDELEDLTGCGSYIGDYKLNDKWMLVAINDQVIDQDGLHREASMEIQLMEKMLFGSAGCNHYTGKAEMDNGKLRTGPMASTKMACQEMWVETEFLNALSNKLLDFEINGDELVLSDNGTQLTFTRE